MSTVRQVKALTQGEVENSVITGVDQAAKILALLSTQQSYVGLCYPSGANTTNMTAAAGGWAYGAYAEVVPVSTITKEILIFGITVILNVADQFEVNVVSGSVSRQIGHLGAAGVAYFLPIAPMRVAANVAVTAALRTGGGGSDTGSCKINYVEMS